MQFDKTSNTSPRQETARAFERYLCQESSSSFPSNISYDRITSLYKNAVFKANTFETVIFIENIQFVEESQIRSKRVRKPYFNFFVEQ